MQMPTQLSFGDFVKLLAALLQNKKIRIPFKNEELWHILFYKLTQSARPYKPRSLTNVRFDWDGPYPKSQQLSEFIKALHCTASVTASNPYYETITLPGELENIWMEQFNMLSGDDKDFLNFAAEEGQHIFTIHGQ